MVSDALWHVYVILNAKSDEFPMGRLQFSSALEPDMAKFVTPRHNILITTNLASESVWSRTDVKMQHKTAQQMLVPVLKKKTEIAATKPIQTQQSR